MNCEFLDSICCFQIQFQLVLGVRSYQLSEIGYTFTHLGVKVDLPAFNAAETILIHPGKNIIFS